MAGMEFDTDRRRFLELAGTGTALSLAGCSALQGDAESQESTETASGGAPEGEKQVAVAVRPDQQKLQQRQQKARSELESGNISRDEARQRVQTAQQELRSEAVASFRQRAESNSELSVDGSVEQFGILSVSGSATALVDSLSFAEVNALLPMETFQRAKSQAEQQSGTATTSN